ncbi:hypothetical protein [Xanthomonas euvesicatoria]|uniref:hypothetical protein n=1 Tax=Xanthomonas euvesicatoria TaxID=456327 RepID=UPI0009BFCC3D|nr:hypothetical protein [Xanthomonas euvesicatoria]MCC8799119.1 hypothetical protein [Xanthomonas euvesicatoria pv. euvesicatoria]MCC8807724.1 hypothetical protein [Xanthomonas euvesicatoria pv. euvesicatoria]MCC8816169.1 hypothetical protein [Xanthomonas euvesicatoria pv. euvesicatoria]
MSKWKISMAKFPKVRGRVLPKLWGVADWIEGRLRKAYRSLRDRMSPPVAVMVKKGTVTIAESIRAGGRVHILDVRPSHDQPVSTLQLKACTVHVGASRIPYGSVEMATAAYSQLRKAVLPTSWSTWVWRLFGLLALAFVLRLLLIALVGGPAASTQAGSDLQGATARLATDPNYFPPEPAAQPLPGAAELFGAAAPAGNGDLADQIYKQARAAAARTEHENMPPQPSVNVEGLSGFGLEETGDQAGPGCDPNLAFKVVP